MRRQRFFSRFGGDQAGTALVEFALVCPMLIVLLVGMLGWGTYFWMAHSVQQVANDAARAAVAGLNGAERESLAKAAATQGAADYAGLSAALLKTTVSERTDRAVVSVSYDASNTVVFAFAKIAPMPSSMITRQASVRLGGY
ncbi:TadE/TadG family type IV pilus assembly protein [Caulobacter endophyticus]|uniref:TadE/TadG family type IV pilus assembly protein n=1 Tax=Caulobacter endophyticus TaxID=2172652 RepID=UPI00240FEFCA|nr:TadE/TadG family type IV pilus assembly protein [Caulobacter endophyticus]MDG2529971.1 TadE/TadG family type IV pilus assembly protein [Caulobacter endophyticus]